MNKAFNLIIASVASLRLMNNDDCTNTNFSDDGARLTDNWGDGCREYALQPSWCGNYNNVNFKSDEMCCACGGGDRGSDD